MKKIDQLILFEGHSLRYVFIEFLSQFRMSGGMCFQIRWYINIFQKGVQIKTDINHIFTSL